MSLGQAARVGPYEIVEPIGRGAMGDVYLARDSRLNRNVAIKVISEAAADENRRRRFTQEARAASSLNHPNIVTVHDFGTQGGLSYIVSELVEGESLRALIKRGPLPMTRLVGIAIQIAEGLAAAHESGIIHRDLKPENIMLTRDGRVKILDFGLAKPLIEDHLEGATLDGATMDDAISGTEPGLILGTVGYMSPEQARGAAVGPPSDQFALGLLLHEMATGHQAFRGTTPMETLIQIANIEAPPFTPGPVSFRMLVDRCLARDPEQRFTSTREIVERLHRIRAQISQDLPALVEEAAPEPAVRPEVTAGHVPQHWWQRISPRLVAAGLFAMALVALGMVLAWRYFTPALGDPLAYKFTPLATESGLELYPAWSPNGRLIAYSAERNGVFQILTRSPKSSLFTQVTRSPSDCWFPFWSADGSRIYFISAPNGDPALWVVNATGGEPEMVAADVVQAALSHDGSRLAMLKGKGPVYSLWVASPSGARPVQPNGFAGRYFLASSFLRFAPDGRSLGLWASTPEGRSEFHVLHLDSGDSAQYFSSLDSAPLARAFSWLPGGRRILFGERNGFWSSDHLWVGDTRTGDVRLITNGTGREQWPAVGPSGKEAAFAALELHYEIVNVPLEGDVRLERTPAGELSETSPAWSPTNNEYAYVTAQAGEPEIRMRNADSGWERKLAGARDFDGSGTLSLSGLAFAPNGQSVAFSRDGNGSEAVWIAATSGEPPVRLAQQPGGGMQLSPTWSPDGNWVAFFTIRNGKQALEKARVGSNSPPTLIRENAGVQPEWSPRGDVIALIAPEGGLNLVSPDGAVLRHLGSPQWLAIAWTKHGSHLLGLQRGPNRRLVLAWVDVGSGIESRLSDLGPYPADFSYASGAGIAPISGFSISPDSKTLALSAIRVRSDLWLLQGLSR